MVRHFEISAGSVTIAGKVFGQDLSKTAPCIILCHEFGLSMRSTTRYALRLCQRGYQVLVFDFPGSGAGRSRGRSSTEASVLTEVADLQTVFEYACTQPFVDKSHIVLAGASQGGLVAALLAARHASQIEKLVLYYPALNIPDDARRGNMLGTHIDPNRIPDTFRVMGYVRLGRRYVTDAQALDPWKEIGKYAGPVLICHGADDKIVDISYARRAAAEYPDATLVELPGAGHLFAAPWTVDRAVDVTFGFLSGDTSPATRPARS